MIYIFFLIKIANTKEDVMISLACLKQTNKQTNKKDMKGLDPMMAMLIKA